jgi:hypothetical protein
MIWLFWNAAITALQPAKLKSQIWKLMGAGMAEVAE